MADRIDKSKGFYAFLQTGDQLAWHKKGKNVPVIATGIRKTDAATCLQDGGLDFLVMKLPNQHNIPIGTDEDGNPKFLEVVSDGSFFTWRTDVPGKAGILGDKIG